MDRLKITITGLTDITVEDITIGKVRKRNVNSKFEYDENNNYIGEINHQINDGVNYDLFIEITGQGDNCSCNIFNDTKQREYGTQTDPLAINGGVNFNFDIY
ncbi:MAG: hypothetical protein IPO62_00345 [Saprospiraceae bacterium]|nr:hypothetical protein [Saprospiraceae bacterium]MBK9629512.1 hypothetical protein [Saprospiraceae bacterium]